VRRAQLAGIVGTRARPARPDRACGGIGASGARAHVSTASRIARPAWRGIGPRPRARPPRLSVSTTGAARSGSRVFASPTAREWRPEVSPAGPLGCIGKERPGKSANANPTPTNGKNAHTNQETRERGQEKQGTRDEAV